MGAINKNTTTSKSCHGTVVNVATDSTAVTTNASRLLGIYVNTAIAAEAVGLHDGTGGTELITLPTGLAAGTKIDFNGITFQSGIYVESTNATGNITVEWN